jgi:kinesin family member C1
VRRGGSKDEIPVFLTKEKLTALPAWDTKGRLEDMEQMYLHLRSQFASAADSKSTLEETLSLYKSQGTAHPNIRLLSTR